MHQLSSLVLPFLPPSLTQILFHHKVTKPEPPHGWDLQKPFHETNMPHDTRDDEPDDCTDSTCRPPCENLFCRMIIEVDSAPRNSHCNSRAGHRQSNSLPPLQWCMIRGSCSWLVSEEQEQTCADGEERHKLGVRRGHAIAFTMHLQRPLLFDEALKAEIQRLACYLPGKEEKDLDFACRIDQDGVSQTQCLR